MSNVQREWTGRELAEQKRAFYRDMLRCLDVNQVTHMMDKLDKLEETLDRRDAMPTATRIARDVSQLDPIWAQTLAWGYMRMLPIVDHMAKEECWDWDPCSPEFDLPITGPDARSLKCPPCRARELLARINPP